ncbi:MAG: sensor domain-containing diguanylate cyclase [Deltaproteobacteria bacterium]|nr:sensor domain-containing diguanylate cyclase [Deltaproteobacteria bacterium]
MTDINKIIQRLKQNEEISKKFNEVETKILSILGFKDLFEVLLSEIKKKFTVPYVWISMVEKNEVSSLIDSLEDSELLKEHINIIDQETFLELVGNSTEPVLANENLKPYFKLLPKNRKYFIRSLAVAPISLDGKIIGSLNQADSSSTRFQPGIDASLLEQLAIKVSLCLSNVTAHEKLKFYAYHDSLTGLLNRRVMETILEREFQRARRYLTSLSLAFIDIDFFKHVNDTYGHSRGDDLLIYVADTFKKMTRESDIVTRFAGDKFVILLPAIKSESAMELIGRIKAHLKSNPFYVNETAFPISLSCGIASIPDVNIDNPSKLLSRADNKMMKEKKTKEKLLTGELNKTGLNQNVITFQTAVHEEDSNK